MNRITKIILVLTLSLIPLNMAVAKTKNTKKTLEQRVVELEKEVIELRKSVYYAKALATGGVRTNTIYTYETEQGIQNGNPGGAGGRGDQAGPPGGAGGMWGN